MTGFVLWFTGLSGAGKSTLASLVAAELRARGVHVEVLDGDDVRTHLSKGLGFSREDRDTNIRRIGFVAKLIARAGGCAMTAAISPYRDTRDEQRQKIGRFVEVYLECPVPVLSDRDPKGLYKKALAGEIQHFTGIDDPYEPPLSPEVTLDTSTLSPPECVARILETIERLGYLEKREANTEMVGRPYGELPLIRKANETEGLPVVETEDADTLRWLVSGLLAPLAGPFGEKDRTRVGKDRRLERGLLFDFDASVRASSERAIDPDGKVALVDARSKQLLATLSGAHLYGEQEGAKRIEGTIEASPLEETGLARQARETLAERGGSVAGMFVDRAMHEGDAVLARVALEVHETLLILVAGTAEIAHATRGVVDREGSSARVVLIEMPALAPPIARAVALKNAGVMHVVVREDDAALARAIQEAGRELGLASGSRRRP